MAVRDIVIEDSRGVRLRSIQHDPLELHAVFQKSWDDDGIASLRYVDPYGDTIFNRLQAAQLLVELSKLSIPGMTLAQQAALRSLEELAQQCASSPHHYLRFCGD